MRSKSVRSPSCIAVGSSMDPDAVETVERVPHGGADRRDVLDFSANINPCVPEGVGLVYADALDRARSYPPEPPASFAAAAARFLGVTPDEIVPTPGGLAAIRLAIETTIRPGESVLIPSPSFGEYAREVRLAGGVPRFVDESAVMEADLDGHRMGIVCQPNNPTGRLYDPAELRQFAKDCHAAGTTLLVDEAFLGFTDTPSLAGTDGVIVARSLTKLFGLPGLRTGYAVARGEHHRRLANARRTWNLGVPALATGTYCLTQDAFVAETRTRTVAERDRMAATLGSAFDVHPSAAPYLLLSPRAEPVGDVVDRAGAAGIAIRDARSFRGLDAHLRVAVRLPDENDRLVESLLDV